MNKSIIICMALFLSVMQFSFSQPAVLQVKFEGSKEWSYVNPKGDVLLQPGAVTCDEFTEDGLATVNDMKNKKLYFINIKGEALNTEVQDFKLIERFGFGLSGFENGFVPIKKVEKWGFLNTAGKLAIPMKYDKITNFNGGFATVAIAGKYMVVDGNGMEYPVNIENLVEVKHFSEQLAPFKLSNGKLGYIDTKGVIAIEAKFDNAGFFKNNLAWAKEGTLIGFINKKGEWVIKPQFTAAEEFDSELGLAKVKMADKTAYVNIKGELITITISETFDDFFDGVAKGKKLLKYGFYNEKNEWAIEPKFEGVRDFKNGYAAAKLYGKWGLIDKQGLWVIEPKFIMIKDVVIIK